jgi:hypothetical protein
MYHKLLTCDFGCEYIESLYIVYTVIFYRGKVFLLTGNTSQTEKFCKWTKANLLT